MAAQYRLLIDWQDNDWAAASADVTARTLDQRNPVTVRYGRDQARQLSPISPGELACELDNASRDYSPENSASPLAGYVTSGRKVSFQAVNAGATTVLYSGYVDDFDLKPGVGDQSVPVTCIDALGRLRGVQVTTPMHQGIRTGDAINYVLDAVGFPPDKRDIDPGVSFLPFWWLDQTDAYEAVMALVDSDGPAALVTVDENRNFVFRDRHHRLTRAASLTAQATWRSADIEPVLSEPVVYNHGWKEIVNSVSVEVPVRTIDSNFTAVWTSEGLITVPAGSTGATVIAHASTPFLNAVTPVDGTDFDTISGSVTVSISQTSGQSTGITLVAGGGVDATVQGLSLRANAVNSTNVVVSAEDAESVGKYGPKSLDAGRLPVWANVYDAAAILTLIVAKRGERLPTLQVTMRGGGSPQRLAECLGRNLSDRVHVTESLTGLDSDCFIEQIQHTVGQGGTEHVTTFGVEKIPPVVSNPFTFDLAGAGFDQGLFNGPGADNPANMFRFDTVGQGFDQGVFSY